VSFATLLLGTPANVLGQSKNENYYRVSYLINSLAFISYFIAFGFVVAAEAVMADIAYDLNRIARLVYTPAAIVNNPALLHEGAPAAEVVPLDHQRNVHVTASVIYCSVIPKRRTLEMLLSLVILFGAAIGTALLASTIILQGQYRVGRIQNGDGIQITILVTLTLGGLLAFIALASVAHGISRGSQQFVHKRQHQSMEFNPFMEDHPGLGISLRWLLAGLPIVGFSRYSRKSAENRWVHG